MKKYSKNYIYYHLVVDFIVIFFITFCFFTEIFSDGEIVLSAETLPKVLLYFALVYIPIYIIKTIYSIFYYKMSGYELKNDKIECQRGVLFKKKSILEYKKIHAVNKKQNLFHKLFKIAVLTLDSGSANTGHTAEILIIEDAIKVDELIEEIKLRQSGNFEGEDVEIKVEEKENLYEFNAKSKILYSLINAITTLAVLVVLSLIAIFIFSFGLPFLLKFITAEDFSIIIVVASFVLLAYLGVSVFTFIISILVSFLSYYKFRVYKNENDIEINYGFFVNNNNTFKLNKIKGVVITQSIIQKLFKLVSVKLEVIGYSDTSSEDNSNKSMGILFPLCKESEVEENIKRVLPSYVPDKKENKAKKYFPFISWTSFFIAVFSVLTIIIVALELALFKVHIDTILTVVLVLTLSVLLVLAFVLLGGLFEYLNNGITINGDKLTVINGGFTKKTTVIHRKHVIGIEDITTPLRKKVGVYSFKIHFRANDETNVIKLKNVDESLIEELRNVVIY